MSESPEYVLFASGGNDSVALVQYAIEVDLQNVAVAYSDTGWSAPWWPERMARFETFVLNAGFTFTTIASEGMENLVDRKKGWPANKPKFCTYELKIKPAKEWLAAVDPDCWATAIVGIRREESAARMNWPEHVYASENHGGRELWAPLVRHVESNRNELIHRAGWEVLPYRSKECFPCVNSNREDFRLLAEHPERIALIAKKESEMGEKKTMFRPQRFMGARGIEEVVRWGMSDRGQFIPESGGCDSGMCGD